MAVTLASQVAGDLLWACFGGTVIAVLAKYERDRYRERRRR